MMMAVAVGVAGVTCLAEALLLLRPSRMTDGKALAVLGRLSPDDLDLPFERLRFTVVKDGTSLAAWFVPHDDPSTDRTCVLIHGYGDAKVGALAWASLWRPRGFHLLLVDLRAHGESGGRFSTGGVHEGSDVADVLRQWSARRPDCCRGVVLFGVSLGAAAAVGAAFRLAGERPGWVRGLVLESPFADYRTSVGVWATRMRMPLASLRPLTIRLAEALAGVRFAGAAPAAWLPRVGCPVLAIHGGRDPLVASDDVENLAGIVASLPAGSSHWVVPDAWHATAWASATEAYGRRVSDLMATIDPPRSRRPDPRIGLVGPGPLADKR